MSRPRIDDATVAAFQRDGVVLLPGLLADRVDKLAAAIEDNMAAPGPFERTYQPADGTARFFQDYCNWQRIAGYRDAVLNSGMAEAAARLMGSECARIFHEHVLVKEPGNSMKTPWHQDQPYYLVEGDQSVSFWVTLDVIPREIAIEYVKGSHRWGKQFRPDRFNGQALYDNDTSEAVPDVDANRDAFDVAGWAMQPGDAVAFAFRTLHGAPANLTANRRRAISFRWVGDDARFAKRKGRTSPPFPHLTFEDGAPFEAADFPVVWPKGAAAG
jgi:ectoine hydroxylase-related dioxygenase (phytanoyl-CoA dioxygenase family)